MKIVAKAATKNLIGGGIAADLAATAIGGIIKGLSPKLRTMWGRQMQSLYSASLKTANPLDDIAVKALAEMTGVPVGGENE
uniref:Uncharacterized protein n=1 Tax=viral metagenome TaxID=1070528 RepID=A0A6M3LSG9_9ZZZZ